MTVIYNILKLKERRALLRSNQTPQEIILWSKIRDSQLGFKFRRQHGISGYIVDFYCPRKKLVIEIDGSQHFQKDSLEYDENRTKLFEGLGITVVRFTNTEIEKNIEAVISRIATALK